MKSKLHVKLTARKLAPSRLKCIPTAHPHLELYTQNIKNCGLIQRP